MVQENAGCGGYPQPSGPAGLTMADEKQPTSAESYQAKLAKESAKRAQDARILNYTEGKKAGLRVPDLNPADAAVKRMREHALKLKEFHALPPEDNNTDLRDRVARLENLMSLVLYSLNNATIECVGGNVVLTLPDLPPS